MVIENILEFKGICKEFPGVKALDDISFCIRRGEIHAICGENGAGKSTLMNILAGIYFSDSGSVLLNGKEVSITSPLEGQKLGISVIHQEIKLAGNLSVAENIFLGRPKLKRVAGVEFIDWKKMDSDAQALFNRLDFNLDPRKTVGQLSLAQRQIVEIAKAISYKSDIIIMDEPSATLTENELEKLFKIMRMLKNEGVTIIYISHRLEEIFELADRVTVLRDGRYVRTLEISQTGRQQLISLMVGRELGNEYPKGEYERLDELLKVTGLNRKGILHDISFNVYKGEILGIAGLVGAGRTELVRAIFGADPVDSGEICINGEKVLIHSVRDAVRLKMALIPEDRKDQGLILGMSVRENITLAGLKNYLNKKMISRKKEAQTCQEFVSRLKIKTPSIESPVNSLSGGNQQKVVLSKWLAVDSDIIIFDEPTRGIDVGAKSEIYLLLNELASRGKAIIMVSSELPEIIGMCDRILVMHDGRITGELNREDANQENILNFATL